MTQQHFRTGFSTNSAENYERYFVPAIGRPLAEDLVGSAGLEPGERVLDVACGTGIVTRLAHREVGPSGSLTCLDLNPGMLEMARSLASSGAKVEWHQANATAMPLPDHAFDVVFCQLALQFMEDRLGALREMRRVLAPGGRLLLGVPGPAGPIFEAFSAVLRQEAGEQAAGFVDHVFALHDTEEIRQLLGEAEFAAAHVEAEEKTLSLPEPAAFLWQYVHSTPLATVMAEVSDEATTAVERELVKAWQPFVHNGGMVYRQRVVTATGRL